MTGHITLLFETGAIRFGEFTLKSGIQSWFYIDLGGGRSRDFLKATRFQ